MPGVSLLLTLAALVIALAIGYAVGRGRSSAARQPAEASPGSAPVALPPPGMAREAGVPPAAAVSVKPGPGAAPPVAPAPEDSHGDERARLVRSLEAETHALRRALARRDATRSQLEAFAAERRQLFEDLAAARAETARYRQIVIDLETQAPPPLLGSPGTPDDLKLIVGIGPVLERMLYQLGVTSYRQIANWTEREIDEIDSRLPEFRGRVRRDAWVTQARALYQSKYGTSVPRGRG